MKQGSLQMYILNKNTQNALDTHTLGPNTINLNFSPDKTPIKQSFTAEHHNAIASDKN